MPDLYFASTEELVAGLSLISDPAAWQRPARRVQLLGPEGQTAWVIQSETPVPGAGASVGALSREGERIVVRTREAERVYGVAEVRDLAALGQAVPLAPRRGEPASTTYVEISDGQRFREAIRQNLMLGNDQIGVLVVAGGRALLRVERLSGFLREAWLADPALTLYQPSTEQPRLLLPWGWDHPLARHVRVAGDRDFWLVDKQGAWNRVSGGFRDVYDHLSLDPEGLRTETWTAATALPRVQVALRLEPTDSADRPTLWRLAPADRPALDRLLSESAESELATLQAACLDVGDRGEPTIFICERPGTTNRMPPPITGGQAFVGRLATEHLYVPVGLRLAPFLSRRGLVETLCLADDHLTLVEPGEGETIRLLRVPRSALRPVVDLVDYLVAEAETEVASLLDTVRVDLDLDAAPDDSSKGGDGRRSLWQRLLHR
ncbi:MAG: hypothetical protein HZB16_08450 [Armatimonadetes bacterium]|nr:hypothetical protein [Armatimonadota bacterium]